MRKRIPACAALLAAVFVPVGLAEEAAAASFAPALPAIQSFEAIWKRSPFIVETVAVQTTEGLATKYAITGIATISNNPMVFVLDKANSGDPVKGRFVLTKEKPVNGLELVSVSVNWNPANSSVVLRQGGQQAVLTYDPALLGPSTASAMAHVGAVPPPPTGLQVPPTVPVMGSRQPRIVNPNAAAPPMAVPVPPPSRRIIRPAINVN